MRGDCPMKGSCTEDRVTITFLLATTSLPMCLVHSTPLKASVSEFAPASNPTKTNLLDVIVQPDRSLDIVQGRDSLRGL